MSDPEKVINIGCILTVTPEGGSPTEIPGVFEFTEPEPVSSDEEFAPIVQRVKSYRAGQVDPGMMEFTYYHDPAHPAHALLMELAETKEMATWEWTNADTGQTVGSWLGYVTAPSTPTITGGKSLQKKIKVKVSFD